MFVLFSAINNENCINQISVLKYGSIDDISDFIYKTFKITGIIDVLIQLGQYNINDLILYLDNITTEFAVVYNIFLMDIKIHETNDYVNALNVYNDTIKGYRTINFMIADTLFITKTNKNDSVLLIQIKDDKCKELLSCPLSFF